MGVADALEPFFVLNSPKTDVLENACRVDLQTLLISKRRLDIGPQ